MSQQLLETEFGKIFQRDGVLDSDRIHNEVSDPRHPLHSRYEWDDAIAGRKFRIGQIQSDIRTVEITFVTAAGEDVSVPRYVSKYRAHQPGTKGEYGELDAVVRDPVSTQILLRQFKRELLSMQKRYSHLEDYIVLMTQAATVGTP